MIRTRITELLDAHGVAYRVLPHQAPALTVAAVAAERGVAAGEIVKSLVLRDRGGHHVVTCVLGDARVDPVAVRESLPRSWSRLSLATGEEILAVTGYPQGAVAPLALPADVPVVFDAAIPHAGEVNVSSGDPMAGLELAAADLIRLARPLIAPIARAHG